MKKTLQLTLLLLAAFAFQSCKSVKSDLKNFTPQWQQLFNGKDLNDWVIKISKHEVGENYKNTFSVRDGKMVVNYDEYEDFDQQYGHIFYKDPFSAYYLAVEYRFIGEQAPGGEGWAWRNSGAMLHGQDPYTMLKDQNFPISIEAQILGGREDGKRTTSNLCTPGTHVVKDGDLFTPHCVNSDSKTYRGDQWVRATFLVLKDSLIQHYLEGDLVLEYSKPQIGGGAASPTDPAVFQEGKILTGGSISLQSESHPIEFRKVELVDLDPIYNKKELLEKTIRDLVAAEKEKFPVGSSGS